MAQPVPYNRLHNLTDYATDNPASPFDASKADAELNAVETTLDGLCVNIGLIQRDDGALKNESVHPDSLSPATKILMASTWLPRGLWLTATAYALKDVVEQAGASYVCAVAHTSGTFSNDKNDGKWVFLSGAVVTAASATSLVPAGGVASSNVQAAIEELDSEKAPKASPTFTGTVTIGGVTLTPTGISASTSTTAQPNVPLTNETNDASYATLGLRKSRALAETQAADVLGSVYWQGFASAAYRSAGSFRFTQVGAAAGSVIRGGIEVWLADAGGVEQKTISADSTGGTLYGTTAWAINISGTQIARVSNGLTEFYNTVSVSGPIGQFALQERDGAGQFILYADGGRFSVYSSDTAADRLTVDHAGNVNASVTLSDANNRVFSKSSRVRFGPYTPPVTSSVSAAHSLGAVPSKVTAWLRCKTTERGYAVDDWLPIGLYQYEGANSMSVSVSSTAWTVSNVGTIFVVNKDGSTAGGITPANWELYVDLWK